MGLKRSLKSYFHTYIYEAPLNPKAVELRKLVSEIKRDAARIFEKDTEGRLWSDSHYANGYTSYSSLSNLHELSSLFMDLRKAIDKHVHLYSRGLGFESTQKLSMQSCWLNMMPPGATHSLHLHPLSVISGTFYVDVPPGSGLIKFEDPRLSKMMASPPRKEVSLSGSFAKFPPKAGHVILFESWLRHEVEINRGKGNRISISFNYA